MLAPFLETLVTAHAQPQHKNATQGLVATTPAHHTTEGCQLDPGWVCALVLTRHGEDGVPLHPGAAGRVRIGASRGSVIAATGAALNFMTRRRGHLMGAWHHPHGAPDATCVSAPQLDEGIAAHSPGPAWRRQCKPRRPDQVCDIAATRDCTVRPRAKPTDTARVQHDSIRLSPVLPMCCATQHRPSADGSLPRAITYACRSSGTWRHAT